MKEADKRLILLLLSSSLSCETRKKKAERNKLLLVTMLEWDESLGKSRDCLMFPSLLKVIATEFWMSFVHDLFLSLLLLTSGEAKRKMKAKPSLYLLLNPETLKFSLLPSWFELSFLFTHRSRNTFKWIQQEGKSHFHLSQTIVINKLFTLKHHTPRKVNRSLPATTPEGTHNSHYFQWHCTISTPRKQEWNHKNVF